MQNQCGNCESMLGDRIDHTLEKFRETQKQIPVTTEPHTGAKDLKEHQIREGDKAMCLES